MVCERVVPFANNFDFQDLSEAVRSFFRSSFFLQVLVLTLTA
jgi:hypothetical protein